ncbi:putative signal peptide and transmembrane protein [Rhodopirellula islandica]|uniref:Signal peptide and transmembrane protein n=1 Tax=Rhodopirellula islandica TaxID=595434 RepID=A0A0J1BDF2_RHOIS|nr:hypothetical protein [Rhodopirellula islandica]KLU04653.1 putative signal peptide and transmembrane protein [Rhodopirellula islandica]
MNNDCMNQADRTPPTVSTLGRVQIRTVCQSACLLVLASTIVVMSIPASRALAQSSTGDEVTTLASRQSSVATRYERLEELLLRLADMEASENPERSALLRRVAKQSRERFVLEKLRGAGKMIGDGQLSKAMTDQKSATDELQSILKLLMSEDRSSRIRDEKKRISDLIKQLRLTERNERSVRARTENGVEMSEVEKEQKAIAERAEQLRKELEDELPESEAEASESDSQADQEKGADSESDNKSDPKQGEQKPGEQPPGEPESGKQEPGKESSRDQPSQNSPQNDGSEKPPENGGEPKDASEKGESPESEKESTEGEPSPAESANKESEGEQSPSGEQQSQEAQKPSEEQQSGEQQSGQQQSSSQPQPPKPQSPQEQAEEQLQRAIERMKEAQDKLAQDDREEATKQQRQAEEELRRAIDRLEKILRQLREEEMERELAKLEARLRKMAAMQSAVLDQTLQLAKTPEVQRNRATDLKAGDLAFEEQKITLEADRAMLLLREEGSSVAFPEVVSQLREDTVRVSTRLGQSKIDLVTQGLQTDILAALEEMIAALAQAQRDLEKKKQQEQQGDGGGQPSGSGEEPLVQKLAELKLIRTMQTRIQGSTDRYASLSDDKATSAEDVLPLLRDLSQRQDRLYQITRDLVTERNK